MSTVSKFVAAFVGGIGSFLAVVLTPEDYQTAQAVIVAVVALLTAVGVYVVPNVPAGRTESRHDYK